jgi:DNA-directed RNA polymerase alpha subunit
MNDCATNTIAEIMVLLEKLAGCGCPSRKKAKPISDILKIKADPATKMQDLGLSVISQEVLAQSKIDTVGDVITKLEPDLLATRRMTFRALADIEHALLGRPEKPSWEEVLQAIEKRNA